MLLHLKNLISAMRLPCLLLLGLLGPGLLLAQQNNDFVQKLIEQQYELSTASPTESVYLRTNKTIFEAGEDLWFSAYVLQSQLLEPSEQSQTLYVELRSADEDRSIHREMFALETGFGDGHLYLPDSLEAGDYWVVGFTASSMKYEGTAIKSAKKIRVAKSIVPKVLMQTEFKQEFYQPGDRISGKIKLLTPKGERVPDALGAITLRSGRKVVGRSRSRSDQEGFLSFDFDPQSVSALTLRLRLEHEEGKELFSFPVPVAPLERVDLQFLPEGGHIIAGLANYIAFKGLRGDGQPLNIQKAILYEDEKALTEFASEHAGMGDFAFFARPDKRYTVKVMEPAIDSLFVLPETKLEGFQLHVQKQTLEQIMLGVQQAGGEAKSNVHVAVKQRGIPVWMGAGSLKEGGRLFRIPTKELRQGIAEITLYDDNMTPLAERLVFVGLERRLNIELSYEEKAYKTKELVKLKVKATDQNGKPVQALMTLGLVDELFANPFADQHVMSHFLLSQELRGSIYEPAYYFNPENTEAAEHLDLLLLTQGWRAYEWHVEQISKNEAQDDLGLVDYIEANIDRNMLTGRAAKAPFHEIQIVSGAGATVLQTDSMGHFALLPELLAKSTGTDLVMQVRNSEEAKVRFVNAFDKTEDSRSVELMTHPRKQAPKIVKNWGRLPTLEAAAREVQGVEVVDRKQEYDSYLGRSGIWEPKPTDYVCHYNILNCRNHRSGRPPVEGQMYRFGSGYIQYGVQKIPEKVTLLKGYYKSPDFISPDYRVHPEERTIPDLRNTLVWQPAMVTDENGEVELSFFTSDVRAIFNGFIDAYGANGEFGIASFKVSVLK